MNRISAVIITLNEEHHIRECLESVKWADEIVVVDSGSDDKTVSICKEFTERVYVLPWRGFGKQKNLAVSLAQYDWILSIDADERVTPELRDEIRHLMKGETRNRAYYISRKNFFGARWISHCGWFPDYTIRLFNRTFGTFNEVEVHEAVQIGENTGYLQNSLLHYTYRNISDYLLRMNRYSTLAAKDLHNRNAGWAVFKMITHPPVMFVKMYLVKGGFKEGFPGILLSGLYAFYTFVKYSKLWELNKNERV